jgi:hypothetical protein
MDRLTVPQHIATCPECDGAIIADDEHFNCEKGCLTAESWAAKQAEWAQASDLAWAWYQGRQERTAALDEVCGKYADVPTSVDSFLERKREDIEREFTGVA